MNGNDTGQRATALREASEWLVRLQDESIADVDLEAWSRWMGASPQHAAAFDDLAALWEASAGLDSDAVLRARAAGLRMQANAQVGRPTRRSATRRRWIAGLAAGLAVFAAGTGFLLLRQADMAPATSVHVLATAVAERRQWSLEDGSMLELDAGSEAVVRYTPRARDVELRKGQAFFSVAHAPDRPFVVTADGVQSRALGTRFAVAHRGGRQVAVAVAEGRVRVTAPPGAPGGPAHQDATPDQQVVYSPATGLQSPRRVGAGVSLAWREGTVVYQGEPLAQVIDDLNRYSVTPIRLHDPDLGQLKVTGRWELAGIDRWLGGLAGALQLDVQRQPDGILLVRSEAWKNAARVAPASGAVPPTE